MLLQGVKMIFILSALCKDLDNHPSFFLYLVSKYWVSTDYRSWTDSQVKCKGLGRSLVSIHSKEQNSIIKALINGKNEDFWIGVNDISSEGTFRWSDGSALHFTDWGQQENQITPMEGTVDNCRH